MQFITCDRSIVTGRDEPSRVEHTIRLDTTERPKRIDYIRPHPDGTPHVNKGIYELHGDTLKNLHIALRERPPSTAFSSAGRGVHLPTFRRR